MDLVHCNCCAHMPDSSHERRRYFLSSCGHVLCEICSRQRTDSCIVCGQKSKLVEICAAAKQEIKMFFMNPMEILQNSLKQFSQVYKFQEMQQKYFKTQYLKMIEQNREMKSELDKLKLENKQLYKNLEKKELDEQSFIGHGLLGLEKPKPPAPPFSILGGGRNLFNSGRLTLPPRSPAQSPRNSYGFTGNPTLSRFGPTFSRDSSPLNVRYGNSRGPGGKGSTNIISTSKFLR